MHGRPIGVGDAQLRAAHLLREYRRKPPLLRRNKSNQQHRAEVRPLRLANEGAVGIAMICSSVNLDVFIVRLLVTDSPIS
jgi:hypothetical protein